MNIPPFKRGKRSLVCQFCGQQFDWPQNMNLIDSLALHVKDHHLPQYVDCQTAAEYMLKDGAFEVAHIEVPST